MLNSAFKKSICFLLALFMILSLTACDDKTPPADEETTDSVEETKPSASPKEFTPSESFVIVRGDLYTADNDTTNACYLIKKAFEAAYGYKLDIVSDAQEATKDSYEILVGSTNRKQSQSVHASLSLNDYTYVIPSEKQIVICGATPDKTLVAAEKFCEEVLTYNGKKVTTKNPVLTTKTTYTFSDSYDYSTVTINGILLEDYTLAVSSGSDIAGAVEMIKELGKYTGQVLPIITEAEMTGEEESIIRIGAAYRDGKGSNKLNGYMINNYVDAQGNVICVDAASDNAYEDAVEDFFSKVTKEEKGKTVEFTVKQETVSSVKCYNKSGAQIDKDGKATTQNDYTHWILSAEKHEQLLEGMDYYEQTFYDDAGLPYRVYTLVIDTNLYTFDMGSANDGFDYTVTKAQKQTSEQHMQAAVKNGKNVVAAINTDFFDIEDGYLLDDNHPFGMTIKEGTVISTGSLNCRPMVGNNENVRPFFGVDKDNNPIIAMETEYADKTKLATLETACGGAYIICEEGKTNFFKLQYNIIHGGINPRALAGFDENGNVILMVIDGRQPTHSNGNSLLQSSLLMHRFGASDAILFDCGGSANLVLRDPASDVYTTANKPSDGKLRPIYNSLMVVKK